MSIFFFLPFCEEETLLKYNFDTRYLFKLLAAGFLCFRVTLILNPLESLLGDVLYSHRACHRDSQEGYGWVEVSLDVRAFS